MKVTKTALRTLPLFVIEYETGHLHKGIFDKKDTSLFKIEHNEVETNIRLFNADKLSLYKLDGAFDRKSIIHKTSYLIHHEFHTGNYNDDGLSMNVHRQSFLFFSTEEKANYVLKYFVLPPLIREDKNRANDLMDGYMGVVTRIDELETKLKSLK